ncbi:hypothetical protein Vadar_024512 [Vaccinium darrowii]|uniref:Uncharacterized protein n=1 Tax=Vaccinium darrowii TaxID=229202 RepID=A0ACB7XJL5_9ERIC|nr:hypothetical protein Vadar_024512 [Vaccinium darrowii]
MAWIQRPSTLSTPSSSSTNSQLSSSFRPSLLLSSSSLSTTKLSTCSRLRVPLSCAYIPSRRIALLHLSGAVPQSLLSCVNASTLLRLEGNTMEGATAANMAQPSTNVAENNAAEWVKHDKRRMLHAVCRVGDLDKTIKFYTECLGMKLLRKRDIPEERYSNAFLGYGPEESNFSVELTYNYGVDKYDIGTGFGHFGIAVKDVVKAVDLIKAKGGKVTREPAPDKGGSPIVAFVEDPDGYKFKLLERGPTPEPLCQLMLRVGDLDHSITYHKKAYGMELLRKRDYPEYEVSSYSLTCKIF